MKCVACGEKTEIIDTEKYDTVVWRRRRCMTCNARMNTHEVVVDGVQNSRSKVRVTEPAPRVRTLVPRAPEPAPQKAQPPAPAPKWEIKPTRQRIQELREAMENKRMAEEF